MFRLTAFLALYFSCSIAVASLPNINCSDIKAYDDKNGLNDAYSHWLGCIPHDARLVQKKYQEWPKELKFWARSHFVLDGDNFPSPSEFKSLAGEISKSESLSTNQILLTALLAQELPQFESSLSESIDTLDVNNPVELAIGVYGVSWLDYEIQSVKFAPIEVLSVLRKTDIPVLKALYGWEVAFGKFSPYDEKLARDIFISTYEAGSLNHADWIYEFFIETLFSNGDTEAFERAFEIIKAGAERGYIRSIGILAGMYSNGDGRLEVDEVNAARKFEELAYYGDPAAQLSIGEAYIYGTGVPINEDLGFMWLEKAAQNRSYDALKLLFDFEFMSGDYLKAFRRSLQASDIGVTGLDNRGYQMASLLLPHVSQDQVGQKKLQEFLKAHCLQNPLVQDYDECLPLRSNEKEFKNYPELTTIGTDTTKIAYKSDVQLSPGRYKALIIANQNYTHWDKLETPLNDSKSLGDLLTTQYGFDVTYLNDASRRETLKAIYDQAKSIEFNDHFLLFYGGHGLIDRSTDTAYWIPANAPRDFQPDWISSAEIMNALKAVNARHVLLVADSCYSGKLLRGTAQVEKNPEAAVIERLFSKKAKVAITSGGVEPVADSVGGGTNSVFTEALLGTLSSIDSPTPASTIFNEILGKVSLKVEQTPQYADMRELDHDGGDFIFVPQN